MKSFVLIAMAIAVFAAFAEKQPVSRYQSIIDRQMFGPLPPGFDPTKSPNEVQKTSSAEERQLSQEQAKLQSAIHFSVINVTPEGTAAVGFTDNTDPKTPRHYYLKEGEERDGWLVKEADAETATMTIAKGEIEVSLTLGGNSAKDGGATSRAGGATTLPASISKGGVWSPGQRTGGGLLGGGTLRARRLQRQQEAAAAAAKQQEEQKVREAERQAQAEQEKQQREAERAEQRQQLLAIQEELKKVRESKAAAEKGESENGGEGGANDEAR